MSKDSSTFSLTTAIPYVNAKPHIGHVLEWFQADTLARYHRALGKTVSFTAGTDENSLKNVQAAEKAGLSAQAWLDEYAHIFSDAFAFFDISLTGFRRGSDQKLHWPGVQELWQRCVEADDIYKKTYTGLYCVGCESYYTADELVDGKCPEHLKEPEVIKEENYFFRLSKYQDRILKLLSSQELNVVSSQYRNEMIGFVKKGLVDFSVSRSVDRARGVGVPVPHDPSQVIYVWFDALSIYLTAIGWGYDEAEFSRLWPADVHVIGKGITRFHAIYWIGMLLSAKLALPKTIAVHGYLTANGQKMSKSLGNVIDPVAFVTQYGLEPTRFYLLKEIPTHADGDFNQDRFKEVYTADLANGIGNLCSRVATLCATSGESFPVTEEHSFDPTYQAFFAEIALDKALAWVVAQVAAADDFLSQQQPWKQTGEAKKATLIEAVQRIRVIAVHLQPFLPKTSQKIASHFAHTSITRLEPLFLRLP